METFYELRERFAGPPVNIEAIIRGLGVGLEKGPLDGNLSGILKKEKDGYKIVVSRTDHYYRQRFTMAHELAHFILHKELVDQGIGDDRAYRNAPIGAYRNSNIGPKQEAEANRLAALILTPENSILQFVGEGKTNPEELGKIFQVSKQAMEIRLRGLGIIP